MKKIVPSSKGVVNILYLTQCRCIYWYADIVMNIVRKTAISKLSLFYNSKLNFNLLYINSLKSTITK